MVTLVLLLDEGAVPELSRALPAGQSCEFPRSRAALKWLSGEADLVVRGVAGASILDPQAGAPFTRSTVDIEEVFRADDDAFDPAAPISVWTSGEGPILDEGKRYVLFLLFIGRSDGRAYGLLWGTRTRIVLHGQEALLDCLPSDGAPRERMRADLFLDRLGRATAN